LTLLYGSLFLVAGAGLLAITYGLVAQDTTTTGAVAVRVPTSFTQFPDQLFYAHSGRGAIEVPKGGIVPANGKPIARATHTPPHGQRVATAAHIHSAGVQVRGFPLPPGLPPGLVLSIKRYRAGLTRSARELNTSYVAVARQLQNGVKQVTAQTRVVVKHAKQAQLDALLTKSGVALGIMALLSIGLGWLMAGRALAPVRTMNNRVRRISEHNLHERVALQGHDDELKELADNFDGLLGRLQRAFDSQRLFVANASHELRTPVTVERALIEVALADPNPTVDSLRETLGRVLVAGEQQERTIEALLTLARSQRGLEAREPIDLETVAADVVGEIDPGDIELSTDFEHAATLGDHALVERMVSNILVNAIDHNVKHGWVRASTAVTDGRATLTVANTGPVIDPEDAARLVEPFRRLNGNRTGHNGAGTGLGLSIVDAIASAHDAELDIRPRDGGGLVVAVAFPRA
jgi:signal transduction histidine kinase